MSREYGAQHQHPDALDRIIDELQEIIDYLEIQLKQEELPTPSVKKNSTQLTLRVQQRDRRNNRETPLQKLQKMITTKKALLEEWKKVQQELFPAISKAVK
jgi:flagellin-specific chaperone FliS